MRDWLKKVRKEKGLTQEDCAKLCGITRQYYNQIETGARGLRVSTAKRLAEALGVDWTKFFE